MFSTANQKELKSPVKNIFVIIPFTIYLIIWVIHSINPVYRPEWLLENYLVFVVWGLIGLSFYKFRLSDISYFLIFIYLSFHSFGAYYGYCEVPFGYWLSHYLGIERPNCYDRVVHFLFGFLFTYPLYEILKRFTNFSKVWLIILPTEFILSYSAAYEIIEAITAWTLPAKDYNAFVGLQGDIWDGYRDMLMALIGSTILLFRNLIATLNKKVRI
jgi:putative membrane protein